MLIRHAVSCSTLSFSWACKNRCCSQHAHLSLHQYYFPLASDKAITAWIPLQPTPGEMGPLQFAVGSHKVDLGRHLGISGTNQHIIDQACTVFEHRCGLNA